LCAVGDRGIVEGRVPRRLAEGFNNGCVHLPPPNTILDAPSNRGLAIRDMLFAVTPAMKDATVKIGGMEHGPGG
jgi:hypothetical protein